MTDNELIELEKKYYNILLDVFSRNLGRIISDINSQKRFSLLTTNSKANPIDSKAENTIENIIANQLHWDVCSLPVSSDSCYSCGDAIIHIDVKTTLNTDTDSPTKLNRMTIEAAQTSYVYGKTLSVQTQTNHSGGKKAQPANWSPALKNYEQHADFGTIPNLTYFVRVIYSNTNLVEEISIVSVPNGQLEQVFGGSAILQGGKQRKNGNWSNIRISLNTIINTAQQDWRVKVVYKRK